MGQEQGLDVTAEVTPHHLLLTDELVATLRPDLQGQPAAAHRRRRRGAARRPGRRHHRRVATDHAPHPTEDKECEWAAAAMGMLGLETALSVVQHTMVDTGLLDWAGVADRMSVRPAADRAARRPRHSRWRPGSPANLVLVDPAATRVVDPTDSASLSRNTPFRGHGAARAGWSRRSSAAGRPCSTGSFSDPDSHPAGAVLVLEDGRTFRGDVVRRDRARRSARRCSRPG